MSGAIVGPVLVSFFDAGITVITDWSPAFWLAYVTRLRANTLTNVILVPAIVGTFSAHVSEWRRASLERVGEALLVLAGTLVVSEFAFSRELHRAGDNA